ncbi:hypothetical protein ACH5RR_022701 [Cinchona calisaya]|uniref:non-specific serine/threonine protein kinase n=1 Tax=Cinchona calisaya TaxID=153742 RepID=A0ABD2ZA51_9GENT
MVPRIQVYLVVIFIQVLVAAAWTNPSDFNAMQALRGEWKNTPPSWVGPDPCGMRWDGITCINYRIVSIMCASFGLSGQLPADIGSLSELQILSLNSNKFIGEIPSSIGTLPKLLWLDIGENRLTGRIPVSNESASGLDMLVQTNHFHFGNNQLSGEIPSQLFSTNMSLFHLLLENNLLNGSIPATLGLVQSLELVRLDRNSLSGPVPQNLSKLSNVQDLYLSNNNLGGPLPDLTGMMSLSYLDMSNNTFDTSDVPTWFSTLQSLTTLVMENTTLSGNVSDKLFSLPQLQTVRLRNNRLNGTLLNGTLNIGSSPSTELQLVDFQNNSIQFFTEKPGGYNFQIILVDDPYCQRSTSSYCILPLPANSSNSIPSNCSTPRCSEDQVPSPNCQCAYPYTGTLFFRAPSFSDLSNRSNYVSLQQSLMSSFKHLPVDSVSLSNPSKNLDEYLTLSLQVFPSGQDYFNWTGISAIAFVFSNQIFISPPSFGPYYFIANSYQNFPGTPSSSHKKSRVITGAKVCGSVLLFLSLAAGGHAFRQKGRAEIAASQIDPFASWDPSKNSGGIPQLGARNFSFEEVKKYTNNFSETNGIGSGGYGKVYRGTLPTGQLVAIKRAQQGSMQGALEFKNEIELLSRVHHKNIVGLVGFCLDQGEEMLVYEYIPNGTLKESLSGKSGIRLDWMRRLRIALGAARGIQYLHVLADPPIIHRDIKSNNVLLDERLNAKVGDFGLSKPMGSTYRTHVTTQVKGTMGYMDPEYYMTNQLTEKSDVYGFGVLMLEIVTAKAPIVKGKYIVREVKQAMDVTKDLYNLHQVIDPVIVSSASPRSLEKFLDLALRCTEEQGVSRPTMSEVVKEIESIMELAGLNPNAESASTSESYEGARKGYEHPYSDESLFIYSGAYTQFQVGA